MSEQKRLNIDIIIQRRPQRSTSYAKTYQLNTLSVGCGAVNGIIA
jgi:hypothetical protein